MEVKLDKRYPLDVDAQRAWKLLTDVPATAGCMPGAAITEKVDDTHYKGAVKVKVDAPVEAHVALFPKYTDADIHNLMAYIQTLR